MEIFLKFALIIVQIISGVLIIGLVLMQHGKGADAGAGFGGGSGGSSSIFGAAGSANFLSRFTAISAIIFFASTLAINRASDYKPSSNILEKLASKQTQNTAPKTTPIKLPPISAQTKNAVASSIEPTSAAISATQAVAPSALTTTPPNFNASSVVVPTNPASNVKTIP